MSTFPCCCRDKQALDDWRERTKLLRQQKQQLAAMKGSTPGEFFIIFFLIIIMFNNPSLISRTLLDSACGLLDLISF